MILEDLSIRQTGILPEADIVQRGRRRILDQKGLGHDEHLSNGLIGSGLQTKLLQMLHKLWALLGFLAEQPELILQSGLPGCLCFALQLGKATPQLDQGKLW